MLGSSSKEVFDSSDWVFELKWDGFRCLAIIIDGKVYLRSKQGNSLNSRFPVFVKKLQEEITYNCIMDGELVVLNPDGYSCFESLIRNTYNPKIVYQVFDLIQYKDQSLLKAPLLQRKELLKQILPYSITLRYVDHIEGIGIDFYKLVEKNCLEGLIAKKKSSIYFPGQRSKLWLKVKNADYFKLGRANHRFRNYKPK